MSELRDLQKRLVQERRSRRLLEALLKGRDLEVYRAHEELLRAHDRLEAQVEARTRRLAGLNREFMAARDRAECASRAKSEFLANMSHEVRTPLNGVMGMLQVLLYSNLDEDQAACVTTAITSARTLLVIFSDILDFCALEAGEQAVCAAPFDLTDRLERSVARLRPAAEAKGLTMVLKLDGALDGLVVGDSTRVHRILSILLSNAVKFTDSGGVLIEVRPGRAHAQCSEVFFAVRDTGIGIAEADRARLFEPFTQADGSARRKEGGCGLGLALFRQLVLLMGGEVGVVSELNAGSTFWFTLPLPRAVERPVPAVVPPRRRPATRVLFVDDEPAQRRIGTKLLSNLGCEVDTAENGKRALWKLARSRYDLVLLDMQMPIMGGSETARAIRSGEDGVLDPEVPIVAMTSGESPLSGEAAASAAQNDSLTRPLLVGALRSVLRRWVGSPGILPSEIC
ncbi:MAG: ATP-binding protein [Planctomycetota bacterium]